MATSRQVTKILFSGLYHTADAVYSTVSGEVAAEVDAAVELFSRRAGGNVGMKALRVLPGLLWAPI